MILGLDISTVVIGLSVMDKKEIIHTDYFDLHKDESLTSNEVFQKIKEWFLSIKKQYAITKINVEEPIKKCSNGKTSINVISAIFKTNYTVCWICYDVFQIDINYVGSGPARKKMKINKNDDLKRDFKYYASTKDIKKRVLEKVLESFPDFEKELTYSKNGFINSHILDIADAIVMANYEFKT